MKDRWQCRECDNIVLRSDMLMAANPFEPTGVLYGCPQCKEVNSWREVCDEDGCDREAACGWPTPDGYRRTCFDHWDRKLSTNQVRYGKGAM